MDALVLLSGGMDSAVTAAIAHKENDSLGFIHFDYGQRTEIKEREVFDKLSEYYKVEKKFVIKLDFFKELGHSSLVDKAMKIPENQLSEGKIPSTYVPFRNGIFLSYAVAIADAYKVKNIYIGAVEVDSSGYPDCRVDFFKYLNYAVKIGTASQDINILTPVIDKRKSEIILIGKDLGVPFELTWSCYQNDDIACGVCDSCLLRKKAFEEAGLKDPIKYKI